MSDAKLANTIARERVDGLTLSNGEPQWLKESRLWAWETYLQTPMPTARDDDWRKTEIDSLDLSQFVAVGPIKGSAKTPSQNPLLLSCTKAIAATAGLFTEDYQSQNQTITLDAAVAAKGVVFLPLSQAVGKHPQLVEKYLSTKPVTDPTTGPDTSKFRQGQDDKFTLMNKALFTGGYFLYVPKGVTIEAPFLAFINLTGQKSEGHGQAFMERLIIVAEETSEVSLMTVFSSSDTLTGSANVTAQDGVTSNTGASTNSTFANIFVEVHAGAGAKVNIVELSQFGQNVFAVSRTSTFVGRDGALDYTTASLGAKQIKSVIETIMVARGGQSDIKGIVLGHGTEHVSYNTIQEHASPDTTSNINFRVALKDSAASIYQGIVKVDKIAQRTNAFQSNKNLLLGQEARADSIPRLEILADDVKCSHGATVGPVDKEQLFYLQSRGLSLKESEELIVTGFFAQVLNTITIKGAADWINALAAEKIHQ
jgi:Fe-S cluster assembly protein SufD